MTFFGDAASNMSHSYLLSGALAGMHVRVSGPEGYRPDPDILARAQELATTTGGSAEVVPDADVAATGADVLITDTWVSMGKEQEKADRASVFEPWQLDEVLVERGHDPIVLHCLPAYRGKEITAEVLDGPRSVVWDEAENRRHAQKAILTWLVRHV
jgi:ornithine carbamoyltransferase